MSVPGDLHNASRRKYRFDFKSLSSNASFDLRSSLIV
jgi:hypothetical protein